MDDSDHDQDTESGIKRNARNAYESVVKIFSDMLERSEARIDRTSRIVEELPASRWRQRTPHTSVLCSLRVTRRKRTTLNLYRFSIG